MKEYITKNMLNGSIEIIVAKNRFRALAKAREWFLTTLVIICNR